MSTTPNWCAVLSCGVDQGNSRDAQCLGTCTPSGSRKSPQQRDSGGEFFAQSLKVVTESERPVRLFPQNTLGLDRLAIGCHCCKH